MSVSVPPCGTRGVPFPRLQGWLARLLSRMQLGQFRRRHGGHTQGGLHTLMLETLDGVDLTAAWERLAIEAPEYHEYRSKTDRAIPDLRLRQR